MNEVKTIEERMRARLAELKAIREQLATQIAACNGAIGEMTAILEPVKETAKQDPKD